MGRDAGDLFPTRQAAFPESPHDVHRTAVPGPQGAHEETRDPGRRDRGHVGRASELRETAGTGTAGGKIHQDYLVKTLPATYVAFDVLYIGTENVMGQNQMERKSLL